MPRRSKISACLKPCLHFFSDSSSLKIFHQTTSFCLPHTLPAVLLAIFCDSSSPANFLYGTKIAACLLPRLSTRQAACNYSITALRQRFFCKISACIEPLLVKLLKLFFYDSLPPQLLLLNYLPPHTLPAKVPVILL